MILPKAETLDMATLGSLDMEEIVQFDVRLLLTDVNLLHQRLQAGEERKHGWHITIKPPKTQANTARLCSFRVPIGLNQADNTLPTHQTVFATQLRDVFGPALCESLGRHSVNKFLGRYQTALRYYDIRRKIKQESQNDEYLTGK